MAGLAADRTLPLHYLLIGAELHARRPVAVGATVEWQTGAGMRWQLSPGVTVDVGAARALADGGWQLTRAASRTTGMLGPIGGGRRR